MNRFDIAKGQKLPVPKPSDDYIVPEGFLKKCELWKYKEDNTAQGVVCFLKSINVFRSEEHYRKPYHIQIALRVPAGFFIELRRPLLMKMREQEYHITPLELKQDYEHPDVDVTLSGEVRFKVDEGTFSAALRRQPSSYRDMMDQLQDRLSEKSRQQSLE